MLLNIFRERKLKRILSACGLNQKGNVGRWNLTSCAHAEFNPMLFIDSKFLSF